MWMRMVKYDEVIVMMLREVFNKKYGNFNDICHEGGGASRAINVFSQMFLAVQDSSIGDLVTHSLTHSLSHF